MAELCLGPASTTGDKHGNPQSLPCALQRGSGPGQERNWGIFSIFNVWTSDVHSLWGYYLAASLFLLCGSFTNFLLAIGLGSLVIFVLMNLIGWAGEKRGLLVFSAISDGTQS